LLNVVRSGYRPFQVVALGAPGTQPTAAALLQDRGLVEGQAAAYVCRSFTCEAPSTESEVLRAQLEWTRPRINADKTRRATAPLRVPI